MNPLALLLYNQPSYVFGIFGISDIPLWISRGVVEGGGEPFIVASCLSNEGVASAVSFGNNKRVLFIVFVDCLEDFFSCGDGNPGGGGLPPGAPGDPGGPGLPDAFGAAVLDTVAPSAAKKKKEKRKKKKNFV